MENPNLLTGEIEVEVQELKVLNPAKTPPFPINKEEEVDEQTRLRYRYLDLSHERMAQNLVLRHRIVKFIRDYLDQQGFLEIETPILFKTHPKGHGITWCLRGCTQVNFMPSPNPPNS